MGEAGGRLEGAMDQTSAAHVRPLRRGDLPRVGELRLWYLAETARLEPRLRLAEDARDRVGASVAAWWGQDDRVVLVMEDSLALVPAGEEAPLLGYATGLISVWPPVFRVQHVGEISECFIVPTSRGKGHGRVLLAALVDALVRRGAAVLRAPVPARNDGSLGLFQALGFTPWMRVLERTAGEDR